MRWDTDNEERTGAYIVRVAMLMAVAVIVILAVVLFSNREPKKNAGKQPGTSQNASGQTTNETPNISASVDTDEQGMSDGRTSDELDIWDEDYIAVLEDTPQPTQMPEEDITTDGNHTMITYADGTTKWVTISPRIKRNDYQNMNFVYQTPIMKYYEDGTKVSFMGVMVGEEQNYIDYIKLRDAGVEFVMIRLGGRNAETGELEQDSQFAQNMKNAADAGFLIGVWFESQAKSNEEATEEAQYVIESLTEYELHYPVACVHSPTPDGAGARTDLLNKDQRTEYALTFMELLVQNGYTTVLGGNKEYLILKFDLTKLETKDIWLMQPGDTPDYPYRYSMWSYDGGGNIEGIESTAEFIIAMRDLSTP
ncbi:MAG: GH25 family lysozyme [Lachnospiraceae bacterium]